MKAIRPRIAINTNTKWQAAAAGLLHPEQTARLATPVWAAARTRTASTTTLGPGNGSPQLVFQRSFHRSAPKLSSPAVSSSSSPDVPSSSSPSATITSSTKNNSKLPSPSPDPNLQPIIHDIFEPVTATWQYVVADPTTMTAAIIDPVLDFDPATGTASMQSADALLALVKEKSYTVSAILETHAHADHLTAASYLQLMLSESQASKPPVCIGSRIPRVQSVFSTRYSIPFPELNGVFDRFLADDEVFRVGDLECRALHIPGHTPDHMGYRVGPLDVFVGDSVFHPDLGTARCDFPGGDASSLFASARRLLTSLPPDTRLWFGHDYPSPERGVPVACVTVGEHRETNKHLRDGVSEEAFVEMRRSRDKSLAAPRLLHQSLQVNVRGGHLPKRREWGERMLQHSLKVEGGAEF